jgi:hypothetical protein
VSKITARSFNRHFQTFLVDFHDNIARIALLVSNIRPETFVFGHFETNFVENRLELFRADPFFRKLFVHNGVNLVSTEGLVAIVDWTQHAFEDITVPFEMGKSSIGNIGKTGIEQLRSLLFFSNVKLKRAEL